MKALFFGLFLILTSSSAWALELVSARNACARLKPDSNVIACYDLVMGSRAIFDELAVGVCDRLPGSNETLYCLRTIENAKFESEAAIRVCDSLKGSANIIDCLLLIRFKHVQDDAVAVCARFEDKDFATDCMDSIAGKTFTQREIFECERERSEEDVADCFDDKGTPNPNDNEQYASQHRNQSSDDSDKHDIYDDKPAVRSQNTSNCQRPAEGASIQEMINYLSATWSPNSSCNKSKSKK